MDTSVKSNFKTTKTAYLIYLLLSAAVVAGIRIYAVSTGKLSGLSAGITAVLIVGCGVFAFLLKKRAGKSPLHGTPLSVFAYAVVGFLMITMVVSSFIMKRKADSNTVIFILMTLFAVLSSVYCILAAASSRFSRNANLFVLFSLSVPIYFAFRTLNDYINVGTLPFQNSGAYHILGMIVAMLFFLSESKRLTGAGRPFFYLFLGGAAILFLCAYDVPVLVSFVQGLSSGGYEAVQSFLSLMVIVYAFVRIGSFPESRNYLEDLMARLNIEPEEVVNPETEETGAEAHEPVPDETEPDESPVSEEEPTAKEEPTDQEEPPVQEEPQEEKPSDPDDLP